MKAFECMCSECGYITQVTFTNYEYPQLGVQFESYCRQCEADTGFVRVPTRKALAEQKRQYEEQVIQKKIKELCEQYGFGCRFVYQSVVITTPIAEWSFDYHKNKVTLYHESSVKINRETGLYARTHVQFRDRKMNFEDVLKYIATHDKWRKNELLSRE